MKDIKLLYLPVVAVVLFSCSILPKNLGKEEGFIWCNARYLDFWAYPKLGSVDPIRDKRFALADKGYLYALAASITLQKEGKDEDKHFIAPPYMNRVSKLEWDDKNGFQASTFELYEETGSSQLKEVIVAFRGTDEPKDWLKQNISLAPEQFPPARQYLKLVAYTYPTSRIVVAGFSLGGGLAIHVLLHSETSILISEAWAFNPSPVTGFKERVDERLYVVANEGEILKSLRKLNWGPSHLGAIDEHYTDNFDLVESSSVYGHSRWVLTRQMLFFADMVHYERSGRRDQSSPSLEILKLANTPKGCCGSRKQYLTDQGRL